MVSPLFYDGFGAQNQLQALPGYFEDLFDCSLNLLLTKPEINQKNDHLASFFAADSTMQGQFCLSYRYKNIA